MDPKERDEMDAVMDDVLFEGFMQRLEHQRDPELLEINIKSALNLLHLYRAEARAREEEIDRLREMIGNEVELGHRLSNDPHIYCNGVFAQYADELILPLAHVPCTRTEGETVFQYCGLEGETMMIGAQDERTNISFPLKDGRIGVLYAIGHEPIRFIPHGDYRLSKMIPELGVKRCEACQKLHMRLKHWVAPMIAYHNKAR